MRGVVDHVAQDDDPDDVYVKKVKRAVLLEYGPGVYEVVCRFIHDEPTSPRRLRLVKSSKRR